MNFKEVPNKYRPIPFWSWNDSLSPKETARQIEQMHAVGIGGYFMHARGGLETKYMGEDWFLNVKTCVETGGKLGMYSWAYDENGWPSGFADGMVNGKGIDYQQKYLRIEKGSKTNEFTICNVGDYHFYYDVNPFYVDTLDAKVTKEFIELMYKPYFEKYKNSIEGFFTDEPQISRNGIPWSFILPDEYNNAYGEDLLSVLPLLFISEGNYKEVRIKFWKLITELFSKNFMKQIYDFCIERNLQLTGHMVLEETLQSQLTSNGAAMPHYEYFTIPGMDCLTRKIGDILTIRQLTSVAHQLGKKQILSETFALCGHNTSFELMRGIYEAQMGRGVNLLCQHLQGYTLRGIRKRDYPPAMGYQQPWWDDYKMFNDAMSRIGMILAEGKICYDILVIHPQTTAWTLFDSTVTDELKQFNDNFMNFVAGLEKKHLLFHLGDEIIMERHAKVDGATLVIGEQSYSKIVLFDDMILLKSTKELLSEFEKKGGTIIKGDALEKNNVASNDNLLYHFTSYDGFDVHYFVNSTTEKQKSDIYVGNKYLDIITGELFDFNGYHEFSPFDSLVIIAEKDKSQAEFKALSNENEILDLTGEWEIKSSSLNSLTLDTCDYYFDGELIEKNAYVLNIHNRALTLKKPVKIKCDFYFTVNNIPKELYLALETPDIFDISINDATIEKKYNSYFCDSSFEKIYIEKYVKLGNNTISLCLNYTQSDEVYANVEKAYQFETEKNKLCFNTEIEAMYLVGDFSVTTDGAFEEIDEESSRYSGAFALDTPKSMINLVNIERQGFPFFAGEITLNKKITLDKTDYKIKLNKQGINVVKLNINGNKTTALWGDEFDVSKHLQLGENDIEITIKNNLRNLLGPHHLTLGEKSPVAPPSFFKEQCVWYSGNDERWSDDYSFVKIGLI